MSSGMTCGFNALAAAAEAELKRTNSCDLQRTASCGSLGDARAMSNHQVSNLSSSTSAALPLSSSTVHTALFSFPGPANVRGESSSSSGSQDSSTTSDTASMPSVADEMDHAKLKSAEHKQRLADLVAADQRIFSGDEGCEEEEAARIEAESDAAQVA